MPACSGGRRYGTVVATDVWRYSFGDCTAVTTSKQAQALAIKLSRERRSGKYIAPPPKGRYSEEARQRAIHDLEVGRRRRKRRRAGTTAKKR